jgi:hypothetical protein
MVNSWMPLSVIATILFASLLKNLRSWTGLIPSELP